VLEDYLPVALNAPLARINRVVGIVGGDQKCRRASRATPSAIFTSGGEGSAALIHSTNGAVGATMATTRFVTWSGFNCTRSILVSEDQMLKQAGHRATLATKPKLR